jgi:ABC-2 type transport system permease protein
MNLAAVFKKDLKLLLRDRGEMVSLFLLPLLFIVPICLAFPADGYNRNPDQKANLPVANYDTGNPALPAQVQELLDSLGESYAIESDFDQQWVKQAGLPELAACAQPGPVCDEAVARTIVSKNWRTAGLLIPAGFSAAIDAGERVSVTLLYDPAASPIERQMMEGVISGAAMKLSITNQVLSGMNQFADMLALAPEEIRAQIERRTADEPNAGSVLTSTTPALAVVAVSPSNYTAPRTPNTQQQTIPGYTVMFAYFLIATVAGMFTLDRTSGVLRRLLVTPIRRSAILGGKSLAALVIGVAQIAVLFAVGHIVFGMSLGNAPLALALMIVAVALSAVCIGLAAAAYRIERGMGLVLIVAALLAGCAFPVDWLPPFLRAAGMVLPQTWAMRGFQDLLTRGQGLIEVLPEIGVLLLFAVVFFVIAVRRFDFERSE